MVKRSKHTIISRILDICRGGACKTRIVYQANLNFKIVDPYLDLLLKNNLVEVKQGSPKLYETTEKGEAFREKFELAKNQLSMIE